MEDDRIPGLSPLRTRWKSASVETGTRLRRVITSPSPSAGAPLASSHLRRQPVRIDVLDVKAANAGQAFFGAELLRKFGQGNAELQAVPLGIGLLALWWRWLLGVVPIAEAADVRQARRSRYVFQVCRRGREGK